MHTYTLTNRHMHFQYILNVNKAHTKFLMNYSLFQINTESLRKPPPLENIFHTVTSTKNKRVLNDVIWRPLIFIHVLFAQKWFLLMTVEFEEFSEFIIGTKREKRNLKTIKLSKNPIESIVICQRPTLKVKLWLTDDQNNQKQNHPNGVILFLRKYS